MTANKHSIRNVVGVHYKVLRKIGEGSFGIIYEGCNLLTKQPVAIKFEPKKTSAPQLKDEYRTYKMLAGIPGIPNTYYFGQEDAYNILIIDLLGPSLEDLFDLCGRKFSVKTVAMLAIQMVTLVQSVHENDLVYRDIKPDNFLIGTHITSALDIDTGEVEEAQKTSCDRKDEDGKIYMVDFGMAKLYRDRLTKKHIPFRERKSLSGTARYMSIHTHLGREQSRRDDLESLGHVLCYFLRGQLPWQGLKAATNRQKYDKIKEKKQSTSIYDLCEGYPRQFIKYLQYCRKLNFDETPDYDWLRTQFLDVLRDLGEENDLVFDWMLLKDKRRKKISWQKALEERKRQQQQQKKPLLLPPPPDTGNIVPLGGPTTTAATKLNENFHSQERLVKSQAKEREQAGIGAQNLFTDDPNSLHSAKHSGWTKIKSIISCGLFN
ncbi:kinase-like domain-containing protein [Mycotypha africana]|uniref:kinase-like domain-containing protein n=1 Tax=Mycotypha africana TaxID=64632 RepID=UPI002301AC88|nr:kinase-like domain-containing protein [Mycotypha africana]KAI8982207.1 kinase-like domain-containing protein [Mycotypha africana]